MTYIILVLCVAKALRERELELVLAKMLLHTLEPVQEAFVMRHALCWQYRHHIIVLYLQHTHMIDRCANHAHQGRYYMQLQATAQSAGIR